MSKSDLKVSRIDFLEKHNASLHHTSEYVNSGLIVRRGQAFTVRVTLSRELCPQDRLFLQLAVGSQPLQSRESLLLIPLSQSQEPSRWRANIARISGPEIEVEVKLAPNAIVGKYSFKVKIGEDYTYETENGHFYVLFNPWCEDDDVHLPEEDARQEYVLKDTGYIYTGSVNDITGKPWNFGQFERNVLDCCLYLLDKKGLKQSARREPVRVARAMSAVVNSNDENGVLYGNWSGNYADGTPPVYWTGSSAILQQYYESREPVRYGQCWVFSGVLTTVMRCLGIPSRSVTNFCSAHDTEGNLTIDIYLNQKGEKLNDITTDSVWNFHVWNDVWMKRPDLPEGYDGWQALDATPQEESEGIFQCGPSPLSAIKKGEVYLAYDTKFIFAEVNADRIIWLVENPKTDQQKTTRLRAHYSAVGKNISTKALGKDERQDITELYKFPEGTPEERKVMERASAVCFPDVPIPTPQSIQLGFESDKSFLLGSPITFQISLSNNSSQSQAVALTAACQLQTYNGKTLATIKALKQEVTVMANACTSVPVVIEASDYLQHLSMASDDLLVRVTAVGENKDSNSVFADDTTLSFKYPPITVDMPATAKTGEPFTCTFTFKNNIGVVMESCKLHVEGLGLFRLETFDQGNVRAGGIFRSKIICTPDRRGERKIIAKITSDQISGISAERSITII
ncbi:protein-glutamine gamma-glutamyltransferase 4 [Lepisosteus oculatus]|uniref:protein-glutamine gamma-glutamyltransferase 4 n=1 Tax=Lepisosteus oculatus TaxID=7918 RepID=UPI0035F52924